MKSMRRYRGRQAGFSVIEAAVVAGVVSVALCGMVASVNTARQLERRTQQISRASASAASQIEKLRIDARGNWSTLKATYDATQTKVAESKSASAATVSTSVATSTNGMTDSSGMWETGASVPNFYFVNVSADVTGSGMAGLKFQTYIANRRQLAGGSSSEETAPPPITYDTEGEQVAAAAVSVTTSGTDGIVMSAQLKNQGSTAVTVKRVVVTAKKGASLKDIKLAGTTLLTSTKNGVTSWDSGGLKVPLSVASGNFDFNVNNIVPLSTAKVATDRVVTITMTMGDGSKRTVEVQP